MAGPNKSGEHEIPFPEELFKKQETPQATSSEGVAISMPAVSFQQFRILIGTLLRQQTPNPEMLAGMASLACNLREFEAMANGLIAKELARYLRTERHLHVEKPERSGGDSTAFFVPVVMGSPEANGAVLGMLIQRLSELGLAEKVRVKYVGVLTHKMGCLAKFSVNILPHK
jgi:hypothetical protein